jgi:hypothetical protein
MTEYFETRSKKSRGMAQRSLDLIAQMYAAAKLAKPITGRGIGYKMFALRLIPSMSKNDMAGVYRLLRIARERGIIPWEWIVDETRGIERVSTWANPAAYASCVARSYRRDFWVQQPVRCEIWSEKGTVRGVLGPVIDEYAVGWNPVHGFNSSTEVYKSAQDSDGRKLIVLYVGDYDPSGLFMSAYDLPRRLPNYGGHHITVKRIALTPQQLRGLPSFPATDKRDDPRYRWFVANYGTRCWELDAMDPRDLRACVKREIKKLIDPVAWKRCEAVNEAEQESLQTILEKWRKP